MAYNTFTLIYDNVSAVILVSANVGHFLKISINMLSFDTKAHTFANTLL